MGGSFRQDVRYAGRNLRKSPGFALVAIVTLALGIGASTAIFSVIENVLMEPFPYPDSQRFISVQIHDTERNEPGGRGGYSGPEFLDYVNQNHVFDRVIANDGQDVLYTYGEGTDRFNGGVVTPGTFEFLGMPALLGRVMVPADYEPGAPPVFVMRYKTWVNRFSADPKILNTVFILNGVPRTLVGVMPPRFAWGDSDLWIPEKPSLADTTPTLGFNRFWFFMGHLKPGVTMQQAQADLATLATHIAQKYPKDYPKHFSVELQTLAVLVVGRFRTS
jgi:putative ABC transport system permease protein